MDSLPGDFLGVKLPEIPEKKDHFWKFFLGGVLILAIIAGVVTASQKKILSGEAARSNKIISAEAKRESMGISAALFSQTVKRQTGYLAAVGSIRDAKEVESLTEKKLLRQVVVAEECQKQGITVSDAEVETEIQGEISKLGGPEALQQQLHSYNWTMGDLKLETKALLLEQKLKDKIEGYSVIKGFLVGYFSADEEADAQKVAQQIYDSFSQENDFGKTRQMVEKLESNFIDTSLTVDTRISLASPGAMRDDLYRIVREIKPATVEMIKVPQRFFFVGRSEERSPEGQFQPFEDWLQQKIEERLGIK